MAVPFSVILLSRDAGTCQNHQQRSRGVYRICAAVVNVGKRPFTAMARWLGRENCVALPEGFLKPPMKSEGGSIRHPN
jgi:hypothetical protein